MQYKRKLGFTLIEIVITVAIIGVLTAIAIPTITGAINKSKKASDASSAVKMSNAMSQFASEFDMVKTDVDNSTVKEDDVFGRVSNTAKNMGFIGDMKNIDSFNEFAYDYIGSDDGIPYGKDDKAVGERVTAICQTYMKSNSSIFIPQNTNNSYWYLKGSTSVICADTLYTDEQLNNFAKKYFSTTVTISQSSHWINLSQSIPASESGKVTISTSGSGSVTGDGRYDLWSKVTVVATPKETCSFIGWFDSEDRLITESPNYTFTITTANVQLKAKFTALKFNISFNVTGLSISGTNFHGSGAYNDGTNLVLKATCFSNYIFEGWYINGSRVSSKEEFSFKVTGSMQVEAKARLNTCTLILTSNISNVSLYTSNGAGSGIYAVGSSAYIHADNVEGYTFKYWTYKTSGTVVSEQQTASITVNGNTELVAIYDTKVCNVTIYNYNNQNLSYTITQKYGTKWCVIADGNFGYTFDGWYDKDSGMLLSKNAEYSFKIISDDKIIAKFTRIEYLINVESSHGDIVGEGTYYCGDTVTLKASSKYDASNPDEAYYKFKQWEIGSKTSTASTYTFTLDLSVVSKAVNNVITVTCEFEKTNNMQVSPPGYVEITTVDELANLKTNTKYIIMNDLDVSTNATYASDWSKSNTSKLAFNGSTLDGNNYEIKNIKIKNINQDDKMTASFISIANYSNIKNLKLVNCSVVLNTTSTFTSLPASDTSKYAGCVIGSSSNTYYYNCSCTGSISYSFNPISTNLFIGGMVAYSNYDSILNCDTNVSIVSDVYDKTSYIGGVVGYAYSDNITNSTCESNIGNINIYSSDSSGYGSIYFTTHSIGGIVGVSNNISINNVKYNGRIGRIKNTTDSKGYLDIGYCVGFCTGSAIISNVSTCGTGVVSAVESNIDTNIGGIIGDSRCYDSLMISKVSVNKINLTPIPGRLKYSFGGIIGNISSYASNTEISECYVDTISFNYISSADTNQQYKSTQAFGGIIGMLPPSYSNSGLRLSLQDIKVNNFNFIKDGYADSSLEVSSLVGYTYIPLDYKNIIVNDIMMCTAYEESDENAHFALVENTIAQYASTFSNVFISNSRLNVEQDMNAMAAYNGYSLLEKSQYSGNYTSYDTIAKNLRTELSKANSIISYNNIIQGNRIISDNDFTTSIQGYTEAKMSTSLVAMINNSNKWSYTPMPLLPQDAQLAFTKE